MKKIKLTLLAFLIMLVSFGVILFGGYIAVNAVAWYEGVFGVFTVLTGIVAFQYFFRKLK